MSGSHRVGCRTVICDQLVDCGYLHQELSDARSGEPAKRELPYAVHAVAAKARLAGDLDGAKASARALVRTRSGRWLTLHGCLVSGEGRRQIAVIVESTGRPGVEPAIVEAYGLSARESEMVQCLLQGLSTKGIAAALRISPYTVQEHFVAISDKVGVRSRRQLIGEISHKLYAPRFQVRLGLRSKGWYASPPRHRELTDRNTER